MPRWMPWGPQAAHRLKRQGADPDIPLLAHFNNGKGDLPAHLVKGIFKRSTAKTHTLPTDKGRGVDVPEGDVIEAIEDIDVDVVKSADGNFVSVG